MLSAHLFDTEFLRNYFISSSVMFTDSFRTAIQNRCLKCKQQLEFRKIQIRSHCLSHSQAVAFVELCAYKLKRAITEPGTAVGAIAATSIGIFLFTCSADLVVNCLQFFRKVLAFFR